MVCHALLQGIFPTQGSNSCLFCLPHCGRWVLWHLGSPGRPTLGFHFSKRQRLDLWKLLRVLSHFSVHRDGTAEQKRGETHSPWSLTHYRCQQPGGWIELLKLPSEISPRCGFLLPLLFLPSFLAVSSLLLLPLYSPRKQLTQVIMKLLATAFCNKEFSTFSFTLS